MPNQNEGYGSYWNGQEWIDLDTLPANQGPPAWNNPPPGWGQGEGSYNEPGGLAGAGDSSVGAGPAVILNQYQQQTGNYNSPNIPAGYYPYGMPSWNPGGSWFDYDYSAPQASAGGPPTMGPGELTTPGMMGEEFWSGTPQFSEPGPPPEGTQNYVQGSDGTIYVFDENWAYQGPLDTSGKQVEEGEQSVAPTVWSVGRNGQLVQNPPPAVAQEGQGVGGWGQPSGYFGIPESPGIGEFGVNAPPIYGGGGDLSNVGAGPLPGSFTNLGKGSHGGLGGFASSVWSHAAGSKQPMTQEQWGAFNAWASPLDQYANALAKGNNWKPQGPGSYQDYLSNWTPTDWAYQQASQQGTGVAQGPSNQIAMAAT